MDFAYTFCSDVLAGLSPSAHYPWTYQLIQEMINVLEGINAIPLTKLPSPKIRVHVGTEGEQETTLLCLVDIALMDRTDAVHHYLTFRNRCIFEHTIRVVIRQSCDGA